MKNLLSSSVIENRETKSSAPVRTVAFAPQTRRIMNKFILRQSLLLLLTATIWGVAFVAQSVGMDYVGPFTFNAVRCLIGGVVLLMYDGKRIFYSKGRSFINALCAGIFNAYFSDRLFFPESGRSENVVHTIFYLWNPVWCRNVFDGTSANV